MQRKIIGGLLALLLVVALISASGVRPAQTAPAGPSVLPAPIWTQVNDDGFGSQQAGEVSALAVFGSYLYAGTSNPTDGALIYRSADGLTWTPVISPGFGNPHDTAPPAILVLALFDGYLYAGTGRGNAAQIWRTLDGLHWGPVVAAGFGDPDNVAVTALAAYGGQLYAGVTNAVSGAQIWRSYTGDSNSWTQVAPTAPGTIAASVTALTSFDGGLHAAIAFESDLPAQIWRSYGGAAWTAIMSDGFGDSNTLLAGGMAPFGGYLYVGAGNGESGAQLWRTADGALWESVAATTFGTANNEAVEMVLVFQERLYATVRNNVTGIEIWRTADGALWEQVNADGFGDAANTGTNWNSATGSFRGRLYTGTANLTGGELWRMQEPYSVLLPAVALKSGLAGETVIYTLQITNTGYLPDTFDLGASGYSWLTTPAASISLGPDGSGQFDVSVSIPAGAPLYSADSATIQATSQGDGTQSATLPLTTTLLPPAVPASLAAAAGGANLSLSWQHDAANSSYRLWRAASPYFLPGAAGTLPLATIDGSALPAPGDPLAFVDPGVLPPAGAGYFYLLVSANAASTAVSNRTGAFGYSLVSTP